MRDNPAERPEPSNKDIFDALQGFAVAYHDLHQTLVRVEEAAQAARNESQAERLNARIRHEALFSRVGELADKMAKQFQRAWDELDALRDALAELKAELDRLDTHEQRIETNERNIAALQALLDSRPWLKDRGDVH